MIDDSDPWSGEMAAGANDEPNVGDDNRPTESHRTKDEEVIAEEVKYTLKDLIATEMSTFIKWLLDDVLHKALHKVQSGIRSVFHNVVKQVMLGLLRKDIIRNTLDAYIEIFSILVEPLTGCRRGSLPQTHSWNLLRHFCESQNRLCHRTEIHYGICHEGPD